MPELGLLGEVPDSSGVPAAAAAAARAEPAEPAEFAVVYTDHFQILGWSSSAAGTGLLA